MNAARRSIVAITTLIVLVVVGLASVFAAGASAGTLVSPQNAVAPIAVHGGQVVGAHQPVLAGQGRARAPSYDRIAVGSSVAAEDAAPRFIANSAGDVLDTSQVTIPQGKLGYLLENPSKTGVFSDSMGFDQSNLDSALRQHLVDNFGTATPDEPMVGGGYKFSVTGPLTGPSGEKWTITSVWGVDPNGVTRLITATP